MTNERKITGKRILIVDDEPAAREALKLLLAIDQHIVTAAVNGRDACLSYVPGDFDLVITDYEMPEMKGDELARTIKCLVPSQRMLMITGVPGKLGTSDNPVDAVLVKPYKLSELRHFIATILSPDLKRFPFRRSNSKSGSGIGLGFT
ncbi:MAG TPA: response regulator [Clostridia bacterium]|nr:response regulator [Clostridia bacterium]